MRSVGGSGHTGKGLSSGFGRKGPDALNLETPCPEL